MGVELETLDNDGRSVLTIEMAKSSPSLEVITFLLKNSQKVEDFLNPKILHAITPLHFAIKKNVDSKKKKKNFFFKYFD